jgi:hypothetical protein
LFSLQDFVRQEDLVEAETQPNKKPDTPAEAYQKIKL